MKKAVIALAIVIIFLVALVAFGYSRPTTSSPAPTPTTSTTTTPAPTSTSMPTTTTSPSPTVTVTVSPTPVSGANIMVESPRANQQVDRPLTVTGRARVFENTVNLRLSQADGKVLATTFTTADAPDIGQYGPFSATLQYSLPTQKNGTLEVYSLSAKDGSEINKVRIPVVFRQTTQ